MSGPAPSAPPPTASANVAAAPPGTSAAEVGGEVTLANEGSTLIIRGAFTVKK